MIYQMAHGRMSGRGYRVNIAYRALNPLYGTSHSKP